jgi:hypothetical protein
MASLTILDEGNKPDAPFTQTHKLSELDAVTELCLDLASPLLFFPVRHHSPACSLHLRRVMETYRPNAILIEGPSDANELIPHIGATENIAPLCVYYSYVEQSCKKNPDGNNPDASARREEKRGENEFRSACYYPLLDFSPELCAVRYGVKNKLETRFIDLPYSELSLIERAAARKKSDEGKPSYYDDYYIAQSKFTDRLCEKEGCRHYAELWEKLFELRGQAMDSREFAGALLALCHFSRLDYPEMLLMEEGCIAREDWMAAEIAATAKSHARTMVVTGGFHSAALAKRFFIAPPIKPCVKAPRIVANVTAPSAVSGTVQCSPGTEGHVGSQSREASRKSYQDKPITFPAKKAAGQSRAWLIP